MTASLDTSVFHRTRKLLSKRYVQRREYATLDRTNEGLDPFFGLDTIKWFQLNSKPSEALAERPKRVNAATHSRGEATTQAGLTSQTLV